MAAPVRSSNPKNSEVEATLMLTGLAVCMSVGGLARWAQTNATVHHALDVPTMPILQLWVEHSPGMDQFLRHSQLFTWLLIQAAILVLPVILVVGIWLLATAETRSLRRAARRQLIAKRRNQRIGDITDEMEAKEQAARGEDRLGKKPRGDEAATDAERLKDVFRRQ